MATKKKAAPKKLGRPEHVVTEESTRVVMLCLTQGCSLGEVANRLGITIPTLRKHYVATRTILEIRAQAIRATRCEQVIRLDQQSAKGNASATKALLAEMEKAELRLLGDEFAKPQPVAQPRMGKKEQRLQDAKAPDENWDFLPSLGASSH